MNHDREKFRFRLTSASRAPGLFRLDGKETSLALPDGRTLFVVARDADSLASASNLHFEAGGYESSEEALAAGNRLRLCLRLLNAALGLGLNVPVEDKMSSCLATAIKEDVARQHGVVVMDNVFGVLAFPDLGNRAEVVMHAHLDVFPSDTLYWLKGIGQLWGSEIHLDERSEDALALLGMASLETSPRSTFLVTYLALERLVPTSKRTAPARDLLKRLQTWVTKAAQRKHSPISEGERDALRGSIGRLEYESFGRALIRLAEANPTHLVGGMRILDFVKKCIATRHATAHPGRRFDRKDYSHLVTGLRTLASEILWNKHGVSDLNLYAPASRIQLAPGAMQMRVLTYERR